MDPWLALDPLFNFQLDFVRCLWAMLPATLLWGASFPLALAAAADELGDGVDVLCVTSADLLFRAFRARSGFGEHPLEILDALLPADRAAPLVTVLDGDPNTLVFLAAVNAVPVTPLGVTSFGQSGDLPDVYVHHEIDTEAVVGAALDLL